jgi:hypothetical protein
MPTLTLPDFVNKWRNAGLTERAGAQMHFIELCDVLGERVGVATVNALLTVGSSGEGRVTTISL